MAETEQLVAAIKRELLLVAVCALNNWSVAEILDTYKLTKAECIKRLVQLDRLRLIQLMPNDRIRVIVARDFDWLPNGPIHQLFLKHGQANFLNSAFAKGSETMAFVHGMLTESALAELQAELRKLKARFGQLHQESLVAPLPARTGTGLLLALRGWEPPAFAALRREASL